MSSPAASSSTARDDSVIPRSDLLGSPASRRTANQSQQSQQSTSKSRMSRTVNTIPVWARRNPPSPSSSRHSHSPDNHSTRESDSGTLPRQPSAAHLQAKDTQSNNDRRKPVPSSSSSDEEEGPSRFWSITRRHGRSGGGTTKASPERGRRPSLSMFPTTLGDAFSTMTSTFGGRTAREGSMNSEDEEKHEEQGDVDPNSQPGWGHEDSDNAGTTDDFSHNQRQQLNSNLSFSRNQPMTPGWSTPWHPEARDGYSIEFGKYRYNNHGGGVYIPRTDTSRSSLKGKRSTNKNGMTIIDSREKSKKNFMMIDWWKRFLLDSPWVPLLFRFINIAFTTSTLAIAIRLRRLLQDQGAEAAVGSSPLVAIIFSPFTLVHVIFQIWLEYFSRPIGLWQVSSKLFYTLIDLLFVCLWSAELAISFDNYFTSTLVCTTFDSPYAGNPSSLPTGGQQSLKDPSVKPSICALQSALIGLVFVSLLAYVVVLIVSLYRIFVRVLRR